MSSSQDLVSVLKAELRRAGLTYADVARELGLAESSIKRMFAKADMPLSRIDEVLAVLKMDFAELAREVALASPPRRELTPEQERAVVADPKLLLVAICTQSQWTLEQITDTYTLSRPQAVGCLLALDKLGFIELRANNHYRLKIDKTFRWRPDGPVMQFFREHAVADYFEGGFDGAGELLMLVHGQVTAGQAALFNDRLQRLAQDFAQQHLANHKLPDTQKQAYTVLLGMRSWLFAPFRALLRAAP
ncbi:MAG: transcriptional regulator [Leptothrix sp. (in: Bacteria)]|nr:transcriptional regulator [Leptothrix sp. (in: b-proteobacteria)]